MRREINIHLRQYVTWLLECSLKKITRSVLVSVSPVSRRILMMPPAALPASAAPVPNVWQLFSSLVRWTAEFALSYYLQSRRHKHVLEGVSVFPFRDESLMLLR